MKNNLIIKTVFGLLLMACLTSCDKDNIGATFAPATDEPVGLSLLWNKGTLTYLPDATEASITVIRRNANGPLTVPVIATYNESVFTLPTSVSFADGESEAFLKFSIANVELAKVYSISIELDVDSAKLVTYGTYNTVVDTTEFKDPSKYNYVVDAATRTVNKTIGYGYKKASITFMKDYAWETLGEGTLNSTWFVEDGIPVEIQKAVGYDIYKVVEPYGSGYSMSIAVNGTTATVAEQQVGLESGVAPLVVNGGGTFENGVITLTLDFIMYYPANTVYYQELGNLEVITLP
jgi:hypothetical protein